MVPLVRHGYRLGTAVRIALAADTASITVMEIVDNLLLPAIPGAIDAPVDSPLFVGRLCWRSGPWASPRSAQPLADLRIGGYAIAHCDP